jgi:hypothetical protein
MSIVRFSAIVCAGFASGCVGATSPLPAAPTTQPADNAVSVTVEGPRLVPTDSNVTYFATATLASGTRIQGVRPISWTTDNGDIASINSAPDGVGELTARRAGMAVITAMYQGQRGTLTIEVRETRRVANGAHLEITDDPNPARGVQARCPGGFDPGVPSWSFKETIAETQGVGFMV